MMKPYLVIWQLGTKDESRTETAIDVVINEINSAYERYNRILDELRRYERINPKQDLRILGICQL